MTRSPRTNGRRRNCPSALAGLLALTLPVAAGPLISNINTDKAAYTPSTSATIFVDLLNTTGSAFNGAVTISVSYLGGAVTNLPAQSVSLANGVSTTKVFAWLPPATDFRGYLVGITVTSMGGATVDSGVTAIDVSSDWTRFPRYGYVSQYGAGLDAYNIVWQLKNYHINALQFYDWQWKHHMPYSASTTWPDIANRAISRATVTNLIAAAHNYGLLAMNYNSYGMAYSNYLSDASGVMLSMGIFSSATPSFASQHSYALPGSWATPRLYQMNNRDPNWQNYIYAREQTVFANFAFDGWHIDTVGQRTAYDGAGNFFNLDDYNAEFINKAKTNLNRRMVFNAVDAGGENQVAQSANVDVLYAELWAGNANYADIKTRVDSERSYTSKSPVFPAYMNYNKTSGTFNEASVRLADAAFFACGAAHLEIGDDTQMLRTEYFPENTVKMSPSLKAVLRTYYSFLVGYQNLLRDGTVSANSAASITGVTTSTNGSAGSVWLISRKNLGNKLLHFINLLNNTTPSWRDTNGTFATPSTQTNLAVKMYYSGNIGGGKLWWATPDMNSGAASQLSYANGSDGGGTFVTFTLPSLQYWSMAWLELAGTNSALAQFEAENYDSMSGIGLETTTDSGGGQNVGFVKNLNGDSYVAFNNVDFGAGVTGVSARVAAATANGTIEFRLGSPGGSLIATVPVGNTGGWQSWRTVSVPVSGATGVQNVFAVFKNAEANLNRFNFTAPLPSPWLSADVGAVGLAGGANYSAGTLNVAGSGADIEGVADAFQFAFQPATGACELRARVTSLQNTDPWAKAGLMLRESTAANAANAAVVITPSNGIASQRRTSNGSGTTSTIVLAVSAPEWLRLVRTTANSVSSFYSADGTNWTQIGTSATLTMSNSALAGLAVTAHNDGVLNSAAFDNVTFNQSPQLAATADQSVIAGATLTVTNIASDPDVPAQALTFSLATPTSGASVNSANGVLTWRPAVAFSPATQSVAVAVADGGFPSLSATQNFLVTILRPASPGLSQLALTNTQPGFWVNGDAGPDYLILASTNLAVWTPVATNLSPALPFFWADTNAAAFPTRFYRATLSP
ncbi:MAG: glycoside hydrolase family 66 protein [Verrucomicrobiota bacterium]